MKKSHQISKLCWGCKNFTYATGCPSYSEYTPGENFRISCEFNRWTFDPHSTSQEDFEKIINYAQKCDRYNLTGVECQETEFETNQEEYENKIKEYN